MAKSKIHHIHVRLSDVQHAVVAQDSAIYRRSIPELLRAVYFKKKLPVPIMTPDDAKWLMTQVSRIGNNVNQIATQLNRGFREGWAPVIDEIREELAVIRNILVTHHGDC